MPFVASSLLALCSRCFESPSRAFRLRPRPRGSPSLTLSGRRWNARLVDDHDVLRMEGVGHVVVLHEFPGLGRRAGRRRSDHRADRAGGERLRHFRHLDHGRARAEQFREPRGLRAVGAELGAFQIVDDLQRDLGVDALARPRRRNTAASSRAPGVFSRAAASAPDKTSTRCPSPPRRTGRLSAANTGSSLPNWPSRNSAILTWPVDTARSMSGCLISAPFACTCDIEWLPDVAPHVLDESLHVQRVKLVVAVRRRHVPFLGMRGHGRRHHDQRCKNRRESHLFSLSSTRNSADGGRD